MKAEGNFVAKLPSDPKQNIVYDCWKVFARELKNKGSELLPVAMTLQKNMPIGSGLGSSACSIVAALDALNQFHNNPLSETELLALWVRWKGRSLVVFTMTTLPLAI
ncbi:homoserine kinase [Vibrio sp. JCM 19236]|nr:homoserine kinase [Vibrio sp. JCM 19236]